MEIHPVTQSSLSIKMSLYIIRATSEDPEKVRDQDTS